MARASGELQEGLTMKKILLGAAVAALTVSAAAPASAQYRYDNRYDSRYDRRGGIGGDIAVGVAVLGGVAAILGALDRDGGRYGYDNRYRYRDGYSAAVNSCAYEAERAGRGRVRITDVDRRSNDRFEVEGVVEGGYGGYDTRYDRRYDRGYDNRGYDDRRYSSGYGERFTCVAYGNGRIRDFRLRDGYASRSRW
jgi:opacity protein-like surface antigen